MITFEKWNIKYDGFEVYSIRQGVFEFGEFLNESRESHNSVLRLNNEYFNADMLIEISEALKEKFGIKSFKILSK